MTTDTIVPLKEIKRQDLEEFIDGSAFFANPSGLTSAFEKVIETIHMETKGLARSLFEIHRCLLLKHVTSLSLSEEEMAISQYVEDLLVEFFNFPPKYFWEKSVSQVEKRYYRRFYDGDSSKLDSLIDTLSLENEQDIDKRKVERIVRDLPKKVRPSNVYVMKRDDGIFKIGRSINVYQRISEHNADYKQKFLPIMSFFVIDGMLFEQIALSMTECRFFKEGHRRELRRMSNEDLHVFIDRFSVVCETTYKTYFSSSLDIVFEEANDGI